ncbi:MAG: hypothetical protein Q7T87_07610 [Polaromonas sp.]|nr:hypothetical protein [Polaromonas sp.]
MPIDSSPEGGEILHQPVVKPFPQKTELPEGGEHPGKEPGEHDNSPGEHDAGLLTDNIEEGPNGSPVAVRPPLGN